MLQSCIHPHLESLPLCKTNIAAESISGMMLVGTEHLVGTSVKGFLKNRVQGRSLKLPLLIDTLHIGPVTDEQTDWLALSQSDQLTL